MLAHMSYDAFDKLEVRCPQLGHQIGFDYCRQRDGGMPCPKAIDCFYLKFPVQTYFELVLRRETFRRIFVEPHRSRMENFLGALSAAQERSREQEASPPPAADSGQGEKP